MRRRRSANAVEPELRRVDAAPATLTAPARRGGILYRFCLTPTRQRCTLQAPGYGRNSYDLPAARVRDGAAGIIVDKHRNLLDAGQHGFDTAPGPADAVPSREAPAARPDEGTRRGFSLKPRGHGVCPNILGRFPGARQGERPSTGPAVSRHLRRQEERALKQIGHGCDGLPRISLIHDNPSHPCPIVGPTSPPLTGLAPDACPWRKSTMASSTFPKRPRTRRPERPRRYTRRRRSAAAGRSRPRGWPP